MTLLDQPPDDAFVRTAIRGMRPPDHHPEFWDALARQLDDAEDRLGLGVAFGPPGSLDQVAATPRARSHRAPAHRAPERPGRRAPLRAVAPPVDAVDLPVPERAIAEPAPAPATAPGPRVHIAAPTAAVPATAAASSAPRERAFVNAQAAATTAAALAGKGVRAVDPLAGLTIRHDVATLPGTMRRTSNIVLLVLALVAVVVAAIAGLSLARRATEDGAPARPPAAAAGPFGTPSGLSEDLAA